MTSEKQLTANRRNAQLSTGPKTPEGKLACRLNALRHGLTGQITAMGEADRAAHDKFSDALIQSLAPKGALEAQLAQFIATDAWRLHRIAAIEHNLFALGFAEHEAEIETGHPEVHAALTAARTFEHQARNLQLLTLYEQRLNRTLQKNLAALRQLQADRRTRRQAELNERGKQNRINEIKDLPSSSAQNGSVFSNGRAQAAASRETADSNPRKRPEPLAEAA